MPGLRYAALSMPGTKQCACQTGTKWRKNLLKSLMGGQMSLPEEAWGVSHGDAGVVVAFGRIIRPHDRAVQR